MQKTRYVNFRGGARRRASKGLYSYDARLLSVLVELVLTAWPQWNPLELRRQMKRMRWPRALLVAFE